MRILHSQFRIPDGQWRIENGSDCAFVFHDFAFAFRISAFAISNGKCEMRNRRARLFIVHSYSFARQSVIINQRVIVSACCQSLGQHEHTLLFGNLTVLHAFSPQPPHSCRYSLLSPRPWCVAGRAFVFGIDVGAQSIRLLGVIRRSFEYLRPCNEHATCKEGAVGASTQMGVAQR